MPEIIATRRSNRPSEGFHSALLPNHMDRPVRLFLPADYQPKYAYPLVVVFHADGDDEDAAARLVPLMSRRNYIAVCPRGPVVLGAGPIGGPGFAWGTNSRADDYLIAAVAHARREFHVHAERIYLIGLGEGAAAACRLGLALAGTIAGMVALNGNMPKPSGRSLHRNPALAELRVFVGHGASNPVVPVALARRASRQLHGLGAAVRFRSYSATHRISLEMLRDVNRWIMDAVSDTDGPPQVL